MTKRNRVGTLDLLLKGDPRHARIIRVGILVVRGKCPIPGISNLLGAAFSAIRMCSFVIQPVLAKTSDKHICVRHHVLALPGRGGGSR
jgi:hypothetical protein